MRALVIALVLALAIPAVAFRPTITAGGATAGAGGGGGGGAFTFVASATGTADTPAASTIATESTLNVATNDLLVAWVTFEDGTGAETVEITDGGSNTFTFDAGDDVHGLGNTANGYPLYRLAGVANATATFTATIKESGSPINKSYRRIVVHQYRPGSGETVTKDISGTREGNDEGTAIATGTFSTTGTDGVVCGGAAVYTSGTHSSQQVGGVAADNAAATNGASLWCRIVTAGLTTQTAVSTYSGSNYWAATAIAFKSE